MSNWGYIVPHTLRKEGAFLDGIISEYDYGLICANILNRNEFIDSETRDNGGVIMAASKLVKRGCRYSIEDHKNAFNKKSRGFEVLVLKDDERSIAAAKILANVFKKHFPERKLRGVDGVKLISVEDRGGHNLESAKKAGMVVAILAEPFFIDNFDDWIPPRKLAEVYADFFTEARNV